MGYNFCSNKVAFSLLFTGINSYKPSSRRPTLFCVSRSTERPTPCQSKVTLSLGSSISLQRLTLIEQFRVCFSRYCNELCKSKSKMVASV